MNLKGRRHETPADVLSNSAWRHAAEEAEDDRGVSTQNASNSERQSIARIYNPKRILILSSELRAHSKLSA
jgi:hypothetical protein